MRSGIESIVMTSEAFLDSGPRCVPSVSPGCIVSIEQMFGCSSQNDIVCVFMKTVFFSL